MATICCRDSRRDSQLCLANQAWLYMHVCVCVSVRVQLSDSARVLSLLHRPFSEKAQR